MRIVVTPRTLDVLRLHLSWRDPDPPPSGLSRRPDDTPVHILAGMYAPQECETLSFDLPQPESADPLFALPPVMAHGRVTTVQPLDGLRYHVELERVGRVGMTWGERAACIGAPMVAHHPMIGRVEGRLEGLLPRSELAVLHVPGLADLRRAIAAMLDLPPEPAGAFDADDAEGLWVAWSTLWTREGLRLQQDAARCSVSAGDSGV